MPELPEYKGHRIRVSNEGNFIAEKNHENVATAKTLDELKKQIDVITKFKGRISVFIKRPSYSREENTSTYTEGTVTSGRRRLSGSSSSYEFRVSFRAGRANSWTDETADHLIKKTPENEAKIQEITKLETEVRQLEKKAEKIAETLDHYTDKELLGE